MDEPRFHLRGKEYATSRAEIVAELQANGFTSDAAGITNTMAVKAIEYIQDAYGSVAYFGFVPDGRMNEFVKAVVREMAARL